MAQITYSGTLPQFVDGLSSVLATLLGRSTAAPQIARGLALRVGVAALSQIQQDFVTKSRGGVGRDGIKWPPLSPKTIAQRRTTAAERKAAGVGGKRVRGLLTPAQDRRWRAIYASSLARLRLTMGEGAARARAAQIAWGVLKSEGAKTKLATFGSRVVDIGRDTSRMFRSLSPGVEDRPSGAEGQVFTVLPARVIVGTNVAYAERFHRGVPNKQPPRPLWPLDGRIPDAWAEQILQALATGIVRAIQILGTGGVR